MAADDGRWMTWPESHWQELADMVSRWDIPTLAWSDNFEADVLRTRGQLTLIMPQSPFRTFVKPEDMYKPIEIDELTVTLQGQSVGEGIFVVFRFKGQTSQPTFVKYKDVTHAGLLKAADSFLIEADSE